MYSSSSASSWLARLVSFYALLAPASASLMQPRHSCASIENRDLTIRGVTHGAINECICSNNLDNFMQTNAAAISAVSTHGHVDTITVLLQLISSAPPSHVTPSCLKTRESAGAPGKRSPADLARHEHRCDFGLAKCGLRTGLSYAESLELALSTGRAREGSMGMKHPLANSLTLSDYSILHAYECLDTHTNLESCGGCAEPYTFGLLEWEIDALVPGVDCTAEQGVSDVECWRGRCLIHKCKKGWELVPEEGEDARERGLMKCVPKAKGSGGKAHWRDWAT